MEPIVYFYSNEDAPKDMKSLRTLVKSMGKGAWDDFWLTNRSTIGKGAKFGAGVLAGSYYAQETGTATPLQWVLRRFGPLPLEFTKSGKLQIFTLTMFERFKAMAVVAGYKFVCVTIAYEAGVVIGSVANQFLSQETKDAIGGTMYGILCEEGWKDLWRHPFGYGVIFGPKGKRLINY